MNGNEALEGSLMFLNLVHIPPKNIGCVPLKQENSRRLFGVFPMSAQCFFGDPTCQTLPVNTTHRRLENP